MKLTPINHFLFLSFRFPVVFLNIPYGVPSLADVEHEVQEELLMPEEKGATIETTRLRNEYYKRRLEADGFTPEEIAEHSRAFGGRVRSILEQKGYLPEVLEREYQNWRIFTREAERLRTHEYFERRLEETGIDPAAIETFRTSGEQISGNLGTRILDSLEKQGIITPDKRAQLDQHFQDWLTCRLEAEAAEFAKKGKLKVGISSTEEQKAINTKQTEEIKSKIAQTEGITASADIGNKEVIKNTADGYKIKESMIIKKFLMI